LNEQEGQKPSQIITSQLNVGGVIKKNASNGNTDVLINNREITKEELWMLKVGVLDSVWLDCPELFKHVGSMLFC
jgi:hypothetical protein